MAKIFLWLQSTALSHFMLDFKWAWALGEVLHYLAMSVFFGSVLLMDLRLVGFFRRRISLHGVHKLTPWALGAFLINLLTGIAFLVTRPEAYFINSAYRLKIICMFLAALNFLAFWFVVRARLANVADDADTDGLAKAVGAFSIVLWTTVIVAGRMIPVYGLG